MSQLDALLEEYGESHQNATNKLIHWVCIPSIVFSLMGILYAIPFPFAEKTFYFNWAVIVYVVTLIYYLRLSLMMAFGMSVVVGAMIIGNDLIYNLIGRSDSQLVVVSLAIFATAWVGQFIGHNIEGKKPSFFKDVQFLLVGPAWLIHFIYQKVGIKY